MNNVHFECAHIKNGISSYLLSNYVRIILSIHSRLVCERIVIVPDTEESQFKLMYELVKNNLASL